MKKFCVILFMSCLLSFMPSMFAGDMPQPKMALLHAGDGEYCHHKTGDQFFVPLTSLTTDENDQFKAALEHIKKDPAINFGTQKNLPIFTLNMRDQSSNKVQVINPAGITKDFYSGALHTLFKLESTNNGVYLFNDNKIAIAILFGLISKAYNPENPNTESAENSNKTKIQTIFEKEEISTVQLQKKSYSITLRKIAFVSFAALLAGALYYNKILPSSMETVVDRLLSSCQDMFSRISSHTNNLSA